MYGGEWTLFLASNMPETQCIVTYTIFHLTINYMPRYTLTRSATLKDLK